MEKFAMKKFIIKFNNAICYLAMIVVVIIGAVMMTVNPLAGIGCIVGGLFTIFILSGFWFVLSGIFEESQKQTVLLEKIMEKLKN